MINIYKLISTYVCPHAVKTTFQDVSYTFTNEGNNFVTLCVSNYYLNCICGKISGLCTAPSIYPLPVEPDRQPRRQKRADK